MKLDINKNEINPLLLAGLKREHKTKVNNKPIVSAQYDIMYGFLKLTSCKKYSCDSERTYLINKDGSGSKITPWGTKHFPPDTFSDVMKTAQETSKKNNSVSFSEEETKKLIELAELQIK